MQEQIYILKNLLVNFGLLIIFTVKKYNPLNMIKTKYESVKNSLLTSLKHALKTSEISKKTRLYVDNRTISLFCALKYE